MALAFSNIPRCACPRTIYDTALLGRSVRRGSACHVDPGHGCLTSTFVVGERLGASDIVPQLKDSNLFVVRFLTWIFAGSRTSWKSASTSLSCRQSESNMSLIIEWRILWFFSSLEGDVSEDLESFSELDSSSLSSSPLLIAESSAAGNAHTWMFSSVQEGSERARGLSKIPYSCTLNGIPVRNMNLRALASTWAMPGGP